MPVRVFFSGARHLDCSRRGSVIIKGEPTINKLRSIERKKGGKEKESDGEWEGGGTGKEFDSNEGLLCTTYQRKVVGGMDRGRRKKWVIWGWFLITSLFTIHLMSDKK